MKEIDISNLSQANKDRLAEVDASVPVYYVGKQWAVTRYGIEQIRDDADPIRPYYHIQANALGQPMGEGGWPGHMANKTWVDVVDFIRAFEIAKEVHAEGLEGED